MFQNTPAKSNLNSDTFWCSNFISVTTLTKSNVFLKKSVRTTICDTWYPNHALMLVRVTETQELWQYGLLVYSKASLSQNNHCAWYVITT